jgi:flavin-binding protein dodecin
MIHGSHYEERKRIVMAVYKVTEIVGSSKESVEDAIHAAVTRACKTLRNVRWFEIKEMRGTVTEGKVGEFQVVLKLGFHLED